MKENVTIKVDPLLVEEIKNHYASYEVKNDGEYVDFCARYNDVVITIFQSKKEKKTVTFFGESSLDEALLFDKNAKISVKKESTEAKEWINIESQIGSDEV